MYVFWNLSSAYKRLLQTLILLLLPIGQLIAGEAPIEIKGAQTISLEEARALHEDGAVFIDVRESSSWQAGHIQGSVHLDFSEEEFVVLYASDALDRNTPIVFYCESPLVNSSAMASFFAAAWGYQKVYYFRDGFYSWLAADYPIVSDVGTYLTADSEQSEVAISQ